MQIAFGRVRRKPRQRRQSAFAPAVYRNMDLYPINLLRSLLIKSALRGTGTSHYKCG